MTVVVQQPKFLPIETKPKMVEWRNVNINKYGAPLIGTGIVDNVYKELYADGIIYTKDVYRSIIGEERIDLDILSNAVSDYKKDNKKVIRISELLNKQKSKTQE